MTRWTPRLPTDPLPAWLSRGEQRRVRVILGIAADLEAEAPSRSSYEAQEAAYLRWIVGRYLVLAEACETEPD